MATRGQPRGRAPVGYVWKDGRWLHVESGEPYSASRQHLKRLDKRKVYERCRYWDSRTGVRVRRLERSARAGGKPFKIKPLQLKLNDLASACVQTAAGEIARDVNMITDY
jgi:hypothetical protein